MVKPLIDVQHVPIGVFTNAAAPADVLRAVYGSESVHAADATRDNVILSAAVRIDDTWWAVQITGHTFDAWTQAPYWERIQWVGQSLERARCHGGTLFDLIFSLMHLYKDRSGPTADAHSHLLAAYLLTLLPAGDQDRIEVLLGLADADHAVQNFQEACRYVGGLPHIAQARSLLSEAIIGVDRLHGGTMTVEEADDYVLPEVLDLFLTTHPHEEWARAARETAAHLHALSQMQYGDVLIHRDYGRGTIGAGIDCGTWDVRAGVMFDLPLGHVPLGRLIAKPVQAPVLAPEVLAWVEDASAPGLPTRLVKVPLLTS